LNFDGSRYMGCFKGMFIMNIRFIVLCLATLSLSGNGFGSEVYEPSELRKYFETPGEESFPESYRRYIKYCNRKFGKKVKIRELKNTLLMGKTASGGHFIPLEHLVFIESSQNGEGLFLQEAKTRSVDKFEERFGRMSSVWKMTLLHLFALVGPNEKIGRILEWGVSPCALDVYGNFPWEAAEFIGNEEGHRMLKEAFDRELALLEGAVSIEPWREAIINKAIKIVESRKIRERVECERMGDEAARLIRIQEEEKAFRAAACKAEEECREVERLEREREAEKQRGLEAMLAQCNARSYCGVCSTEGCVKKLSPHGHLFLDCGACDCRFKYCSQHGSALKRTGRLQHCPGCGERELG
jgi:hypothetical protein